MQYGAVTLFVPYLHTNNPNILAKIPAMFSVLHDSPQNMVYQNRLDKIDWFNRSKSFQRKLLFSHAKFIFLYRKLGKQMIFLCAIFMHVLQDLRNKIDYALREVLSYKNYEFSFSHLTTLFIASLKRWTSKRKIILGRFNAYYSFDKKFVHIMPQLFWFVSSYLFSTLYFIHFYSSNWF